jgi:hypothetical protein
MVSQGNIIYSLRQGIVVIEERLKMGAVSLLEVVELDRT